MKDISILFFLTIIGTISGQILYEKLIKDWIKTMDKKIKSAKASIDKKMDKLVKEDKRHDKKCEHDEMMAKKAKKK